MNVSAVDNADGTGATVIVSDSSGGSVSIYTSPWSGGFVNQAFSLGGSRTGDGTVVIAGTGYYWMYGVEGATATTMVGYRATTASDTVFTQCLDAVVAKIKTLSLTNITPATDVLKQKFPYNLTKKAYGIYVSPIRETFSPSLNVLDKIGYGIQVTTFQAKNQDLTLDLTQHLKWRDQISRAFRHDTLPAVQEVYEVKLEPGPVIFPTEFANNYDAGTVVLRCNAEETRGVA